MQANLYAQDANGAWTPIRVSETGALVGGTGGSGLPAGQSSAIAPWSYAAGSGGITNTSDVTLVAAAGVGKSNYLTSLQVMNSSATATELVIKSGASTVLWRARVGASMIQPVSIEFARPLISANNEALTAACITGSTVTYVNAQGYTDVSLAALNAEQTSEIEIFDQAGDQVFDAAGAPIYAQAA